MKNQEIAMLMGGLEKGMEALEREMKEANGKLDSLPCATHTSELKVLNTWKQTCNGAKANRNLESYKGTISLRNAIIGIIATAVFSVLATLVASLCVIGIPIR